jgi:anti-sigma B factor antagonist
MELEHIEHGPLPVIVAKGDLEAYDTGLLCDVLKGRIDGGRSRVVLEFRRTTFVSATAIGVLLWLQRRARARGGEILLVGPPRMLRRCLRVLESDGHFRCALSREHALALLARGGGEAAAGAVSRLSPGPKPLPAMAAAPSEA